MNAEELKRRFAKECAVDELDTREADTIEWTVAAMKSNEAIEFLEWVVYKSGYLARPSTGWIHTDEQDYNNAITTTELYKLFSPNEAGERTFTLDEMKDCWNSCINYYKSEYAMTKDLHSINGMKPQPDMSQYFKEKFNIDLGK